MEFKDKVVIISGATGGIGQALAQQLASMGAHLGLFARREQQLKELCDKLSSSGFHCIYQCCDVTNPLEVKQAVQKTIDEFSRIDVAILTAGVLIPNPLQTFDASIIKRSVEINFFGIVYFVEQLLPIMKRQHLGVIAATSTLPDRRGVPGWGAYGASKAAVSWFLESLRAESKQLYNINIVTIKPGSVLTPMIEDYHRRGAITPEKAAQYIIHGIKRGKKVIQFPLGQVIPVRLSDNFPVAAYDAQDIDMMKGDGYPEANEG
ncbi:MAG: SDR family NAD(P)-dependent oxidoreductase [Candidatus Thermoplasmatota archaeon]|nr:SDR family NAD(P)-dependent oxidoreductase [Candidatus Thermoplasmatota archaeon]MBU1940187.1 SDR family NAD(P)-dependent oxidoreductase [Candidatus Thermoplasmatota archaeon]